MEIERFELFITLSKISLKENNKEAVDKRDDKDVLIELFTLIVIRVDNKGLLIGYKFIEDGIVYDKA